MIKNLSPLKLISHLHKYHPFVRWSALLALVIAFARSFTLDKPFDSLFAIAAFFLGWVIAHLLFVHEHWILARIEKLVDRGLETLPPAHGVDHPTAFESSGQNEQETHNPSAKVKKSAFKQSILIPLLPILAFFLLTSTRSAAGLGLIWGVMSIYAYDMIMFLLDGEIEVIDIYFGAFTDEHATLRAASIGYLIFLLLFAVLLIAARMIQI